LNGILAAIGLNVGLDRAQQHQTIGSTSNALEREGLDLLIMYVFKYSGTLGRLLVGGRRAGHLRALTGRRRSFDPAQRRLCERPHEHGVFLAWALLKPG
jgi:hypothetical protein